MATRQNKKRKGRSNAPPRERTVTTLTDGPEGSFQPSPQLPDIEEPTSAALLSPPFSVSSPLTAGPSPALSAGPYISSYSAPFSYGFNMPPVAAPPFQTQRSSPQFFPPPPQPIPQSVPAQQALSSGQNDLEILERLKETIKNNQHAVFRPIPRPDALLSVYLGPKSTASYHVPPHPEQIPTDVSPPGLTLPPPDSARAATDTSVTTFLNQSIPRAAQSTHNNTSGPARRDSVSESSKNNTIQSGKRAVNRFDSSPPFPERNGTTLADKHNSTDTSPPMTPGLQKLDQTNGSHSSPGKGVRSETIEGSVVTGEPFSIKLSSGGKEDSRARGASWASRSSFEDRQQRPDPERSVRSVALSPRVANTSVSGVITGNGPRASPRDQPPQDRDRERERPQERDSDRDLGRPLPSRDESNRFRDDRRNDDRSRDNRRISPDTRRYESRHPPRRYDSKASESSFTSPRLVGKSPPQPRPTRNLGEERAIVRPPLDSTAVQSSSPGERRPPSDPAVDNRATRPPVDDKRGAGPPISGSDRQPRVNDDRRPLPPTMDRSSRSDDRRPLPALVPDRSVPDDHRRPLSPALSDRLGRPMDDRRDLAPPSPALSRSTQTADDRRPAPSAGERHVLAPSVEERRTVVPVTTERVVRPAPEDRRTVPLEERISRAPAPALPDSVPARPILEERNARAADDKKARSPIPLEERISRAPSLKERLSHPPVRSDDRSLPRLEERLSRPVNAPPSLEERLSTPAIPDVRPPHSHSDDRPPRPAAPVERPVPRPADERSVPAEPARVPPPVERVAPRTEERVFTPAERYTRPATPAGSDRSHAPPAPPRPYRAPSVAPRDEPRPFRQPSPARSPVRSEVREFRPAVEPRDRPDTRLSYPAPAGPEPDRYASERRPAPTPAPAPDLMDVDSVHPRERVVESRMSYNRPSPPPVDAYPARDRAWVPAGEAYREPEPARRVAADHAYARDWRDGERPYGEEWNERSWDRGREYDRDARFVERDAVPPAWETREERERRAAYPPPEVPPAPTRVYERTLGSRLSDPYPDDRAYLDRGRYAEPAPTYSRVRPRSPSPLRRAPGSDDLRPPVKRAREDPYAPAPYYADEPPRGGPVDYQPRMRSPPPPPPPSGAYYDDPRYPLSPRPREREYLDSRDPGYPPYDRRADPAGRLPPPRSPPPYSRVPVYGRDDRRY
ncbi:hypothetical protein C8Q78DRAFT_478723 [Trametes maxima]|nr:hypothetical protein C8Q78DRAFT_478723 [Trametes maxima]